MVRSVDGRDGVSPTDVDMIAIERVRRKFRKEVRWLF